LLLVTLPELLEALCCAGLGFELLADATRVPPVSPLLRALALWRSARSEGFDLAGLDSSLGGLPTPSVALLLAVGSTGAGATAGGVLGGTAAF
jgi:hypothetical protein